MNGGDRGGLNDAMVEHRIRDYDNNVGGCIDTSPFDFSTLSVSAKHRTKETYDPNTTI